MEVASSPDAILQKKCRRMSKSLAENVGNDAIVVSMSPCMYFEYFEGRQEKDARVTSPNLLIVVFWKSLIEIQRFMKQRFMNSAKTCQKHSFFLNNR
mmetsp:Transcript_1356/g.2083  ORF Transcript_1356/g.2083 Transcript_1356/m.2083 type:complete len:97 (+) Transcript_1356:562-852(+)